MIVYVSSIVNVCVCGVFEVIVYVASIVGDCGTGRGCK